MPDDLSGLEEEFQALLEERFRPMATNDPYRSTCVDCVKKQEKITELQVLLDTHARSRAEYRRSRVTAGISTMLAFLASIAFITAGSSVPYWGYYEHVGYKKIAWIVGPILLFTFLTVMTMAAGFVCLRQILKGNNKK